MFLRAFAVVSSPLVSVACQLRFAWVLAIGFSMVAGHTFAVDYSKEELAIGKAITASVVAAERAFFQGKYDDAGKTIRKGMGQLHDGLKSDNPEFVTALQKLASRLDAVHFKTELNGISLPPFRLDRKFATTSTQMASGTPKKTIKPPVPTTKPPATTTVPPATDSMLVSFTKQVAPILNSKCGRCHVSGSRGGFSAATFADLMKGPPEGVVVFAGDVIGSRLIETIETGDMPRGGGKVTPAELKTLKDWIIQGIKFDGSDPNAPLVSGMTATTADAAMPAAAIKQATGNETVSFSADVAPLLAGNCSGCHLDAMQTRGGLRMDTFVQLMRGGDSGGMIAPGKGEDSLLVKKLRGTAADGERMPGGGRPPLSDQSIQLISKWIDEGATIDGDSRQPIKVLSRLAWVAKATSQEVSARRAELAKASMLLADSASAPIEIDTDHFHLVGTSSAQTLELVGRLAEQQMKIAKSVSVAGRSGSAEDFFHGRSTIFVLPRRYDYSEFTKMVEQRSVPSDWSSHWHFDGEDAYIAMVATESEDEEAIESRLISPAVSLAVATRGLDVPRWFAEGMGAATSMQQNAKSRTEKEKLRALAVEAAASVKNANDFLKDKLTPEQSDSFGAGLAMSMLDRSRRKNLNTCLRALESGKSFEDAFFAGFGVSPTAYIDQFLQYMR